MNIDRELSVEDLEGDRWPDPPEGSTGLVTSVHELRRRPLGSLDAWELARLIGQDVALAWTLPVALDLLEATAPQQADGGFYDDDLLYAVLTRKPATWERFPEYARRVRALLEQLSDLEPQVGEAAEAFRTAQDSAG